VIEPPLEPAAALLEPPEVAPVEDPLAEDPVDDPPLLDATAPLEEPAALLLGLPALPSPAFVPELMRGPGLQPAAKRATKAPRLAGRGMLPQKSMALKSTPKRFSSICQAPAPRASRAFSHQVGYAMALAKVRP